MVRRGLSRSGFRRWRRHLCVRRGFPLPVKTYYDGVREFSVYVAREARGKGFGKAALSALIDDAKARGWWKLLSRIFPENVSSRKLCAALGFREVGIYEKH